MHISQGLHSVTTFEERDNWTLEIFRIPKQEKIFIFQRLKQYAVSQSVWNINGSVIITTREFAGLEKGLSLKTE